MKKQIHSSLLFGAIATIISTQAVHAQGWNGPAGNYTYNSGSWYIRGGVGPEYTQKSALTLDTSIPDVGVKFDPGVRFDVAGGYQFNPYLSVEEQVGIIYNRIHSIDGSPSTDAYLAQIPFLANVVLQLPNESPWTPFVGVGCGVSVSALNINNAVIQGVSLNGHSSTATFAYQAMAGVNYSLNQHSDVSLRYEFMGALQPEWPVNGFVSSNLILRHPMTHALVASFTWHF